MTKSEFIEKSREIYGDSYDYSQIDNRWVDDVDVMLPILCRKHGLFWETPYEHLHGYVHCPECYNEEIRGTN